MRHSLFILAVVLPIVFTSCVESSKAKLENQQQQSFAEFLARYEKSSYNQANEIQKKEFDQNFEEQLEHYLDTAMLFINWRGQIANIKVNDYAKSKEITFEIKYTLEKYREITFEVSYVVDNDNLSTDLIYNKIKPITNGSIVYFDGFIRRKIDNSVDYYMPSLFTQKLSYPHYYFSILDISVSPKEDLSPTLVQCTEIILQSIKQLPRYDKSEDVLFMEANGYNIVPNDKTIQLKRIEFVDILNENGYKNLYEKLSNAEKEYCDLLLGYVISQWRFDKF